MFPTTNPLVQLVRKLVVTQFGEAWFLRQWAWPNPDAGHMRLKLPHYLESNGWPRQQVDLRIRPAVELMADVPDYLRPDVAYVGSWSFDGAEQVALTDFWILVLEPTSPYPSPICLVLPTRILLDSLHNSADAGRLYLYFTPAGECYVSPSLQTGLADRRQIHGPGSFSSSRCFTRYLNAWHQLANDRP